jgi:uncharacterized membrane protein
MFWREKTLIVTLYLPLFIILIYLAAFIPNWKKALRLKEERRWVVSDTLFVQDCSSHARGDLSSLPFAWYMLGGVVVFATFLATIVQYRLLPDLIPVHFNVNMEPTRWVEKSWWTALQMPLINAGLLVLMFFIAVSIVKAKLQIDQNNPRLSFAQHRVYRRRMGHAIGFITLVIIILTALPGFMLLFPDAAFWGLGGGKVFFGFMIFLTILVVMPVIVVYAKTGQGGCKVKIDLEGLHESNVDVSIASISKKPGCGDDKYWKLGLFYFNPDDPAVIVEARFGAKLSFNYAHLPVKIGITLFLLGLVSVYVWLTVMLL